MNYISVVLVAAMILSAGCLSSGDPPADTEGSTTLEIVVSNALDTVVDLEEDLAIIVDGQYHEGYRGSLSESEYRIFTFSPIDAGYHTYQVLVNTAVVDCPDSYYIKWRFLPDTENSQSVEILVNQTVIVEAVISEDTPGYSRTVWDRDGC